MRITASCYPVIDERTGETVGFITTPFTNGDVRENEYALLYSKKSDKTCRHSIQWRLKSFYDRYLVRLIVGTRESAFFTMSHSDSLTFETVNSKYCWYPGSVDKPNLGNLIVTDHKDRTYFRICDGEIMDVRDIKSGESRSFPLSNRNLWGPTLDYNDINTILRGMEGDCLGRTFLSREKIGDRRFKTESTLNFIWMLHNNIGERTDYLGLKTVNERFAEALISCDNGELD